jgi:N-methylhydantoinase B
MQRAIGQVPPGTYRGRLEIEGFGDDLALQAALTVREDRIAVDFDGTSPQIDRAINSTLAHTFAHTAFALKCVLDPEIPGNDGSLEPITVTAPEGSILNSRHPAAGRSRTQVSHYISSLLFTILAEVIPDRVLGQPGSPRPVLTFRGERSDGSPFSSTYHVMAGMGAGSGFDGLSVMAFPTNTRVTPVEFMERTTPLLFLEKALLPDSGGGGRWRGGSGQKVRIAVEADRPMRVLTSPGRTRFAAKGVRGGRAGRPGSLTLNDADIAFATHTITAQRGDVLEVHSAGGGGYEDEGSTQ